MIEQKDLVNYIIDYEAGELNTEDTLELFSYLVHTGMAYSLQGHYGRTAEHLIEMGLLDRDGNIDKVKLSQIKESE